MERKSSGTERADLKGLIQRGPLTAILIGTRTRQIEHCVVDYLGNVDFKFVPTLNWLPKALEIDGFACQVYGNAFTSASASVSATSLTSSCVAWCGTVLTSEPQRCRPFTFFLVTGWGSSLSLSFYFLINFAFPFLTLSFSLPLSLSLAAAGQPTHLEFSELCSLLFFLLRHRHLKFDYASRVLQLDSFRFNSIALGCHVAFICRISLSLPFAILACNRDWLTDWLTDGLVECLSDCCDCSLYNYTHYLSLCGLQLHTSITINFRFHLISLHDYQTLFKSENTQ